MMLKQEKHTKHAISFEVELPKSTKHEPEIKKKLEAGS